MWVSSCEYRVIKKTHKKMELTPLIRHKKMVGGVDIKSFMLLFGILGFIIGAILFGLYLARIF